MLKKNKLKDVDHANVECWKLLNQLNFNHVKLVIHNFESSSMPFSIPFFIFHLRDFRSPQQYKPDTLLSKPN